MAPSKPSVRKVGSCCTAMLVLHSSAPYAQLPSLLMITAAGLPLGSIHADSPFNQLKAALNSGSHAVKERDGATVSLTSAGLSDLIASRSALSAFIQEAFTLQDGTRISLGSAMGMAANVRGILLHRGTCVCRCSAPAVSTHSFLAFSHCVLVFARSIRYGGGACSRWYSPRSRVCMDTVR